MLGSVNTDVLTLLAAIGVAKVEEVLLPHVDLSDFAELAGGKLLLVDNTVTE